MRIPEYSSQPENQPLKEMVKEKLKAAFAYIQQVVGSDPVDKFISVLEKRMDEDLELGTRTAKLFRHLSTPDISPLKTENPLTVNDNPEEDKQFHLLQSTISTVKKISGTASKDTEVKEDIQTSEEARYQPYGAKCLETTININGVERKKQTFLQSVEIPNTDLLLQETVSTVTYQTEPTVKTTTLSTLTLLNKKTKQVLSLNQLLPADYYFAPATMHTPEYVFKENTTDPVWQLKPDDLNKYQGTQNADPGSDYHTSILRTIGYGNITTKSGLLGLLHELGHAWRGGTYTDQEQNYAGVWYPQTAGILSAIKRNTKKFLPQHKSLASYYETMLSIHAPQLKDLGVEGVTFSDKEGNSIFLCRADTEYDETKQIYLNVPNIDDSDTARKETITFELQVNTEKLAGLMTDYAASERDAWADAIRVLRFLRKAGFDPSPQLKTNKDILKVAHDALRTYQVRINKDIQFIYTVPPHRQFTRRENLRMDNK